MEDEYLLIIDGSSLLSTQFYGNLPPAVLMAKTVEEKEKYFPKIMQTSTGVYTNGVFGFLRYLLKILRQLKPTCLAVTWDLTRETFRRRIYPEYKANRTETIVPLREQFALCQDILRRIGVRQYMSEEFEADDFSGSLAAKFEREMPVRILTKDHDYLQLANDRTTIWLLQQAQKKADELFTKYGNKKESSRVPEKTFPMTPDRIRSEFGVPPTGIAELKGLQGDPSDNIKGVPGIGSKTALSLIVHYKTVNALYEAIHNAGAEGEKQLAAFYKESLGIHKNPIGTLLKEDPDALVGEKAARLSRDLATIKRDIPIDESIADLAVKIDYRELSNILEELEIKTIPLPECATPEIVFETVRVSEADIDKTLKAIVRSGSPVGIHRMKEDAEEDWMAAFGLVSESMVLAVAVDSVIYHFPLREDTEEALYGALREIAGKRDVYCFRGKEDWCGLFERGSRLVDVSVMDYLLRPLTTQHGDMDVCREWFPVEKIEKDSAETAALALTAGVLLSEKIRESGMDALLRDTELPLMWVLRDMELAGIRVDRGQLRSFAAMLSVEMERSRASVYEMAGCEFNLNSPKQLGEILFERLEIPYPKKTKSSYTTSAEVLEKIADKHPIIPEVLRYRQYAKLYSTYADGLEEYIGTDERIHTTFRQTVTATGRLSSTDPNMQNIPARTELGRDIRRAFVPADGCVFVDADYSQIELRLMAHLSGDKGLQAAYHEAADIHRLTASEVFGVPYDDVTAEQRSAAKAVNFGILYGISSFSLAQDLGITRATAEEYIQGYFERFPRVKAYLDETVAEAKKNGMVRTAYGRIRPIPELSSSEYSKRSFGERVAMNSPIQGTAADIMKMAMLAVDRKLREQGLSSRALIQVHDELLLEVPLAEEETVRKLVKEAFEHVADLSVPLEAEVHSGKTWLDAK
jgi:DNA polymerase I - 3''-5'' exonuclease and polymerase domains